ncbi:hypothetical protein BJX99DRAFT_224726 [Aspergillus californicus]
MPLENYGVWKAHPVHYTLETPQGAQFPHLFLYFHDQEFGEPEFDLIRSKEKDIPGLCRAIIDIKCGDPHDSRLAYWVNRQFDQNPIAEQLAGLQFGFSPLAKGPALDYIRDSLFNSTSGRLLPHDIPDHFSDIVDVIGPNISRAVDEQADLYVFGSRFPDEDVIRNVHMNQGNIRKYRCEDGSFQDGAVVFHFRQSDQWLGVFIAFASQAVHTNHESGHAISGVTWSDILRPDIIEEAVIIQEAYVNPAGPTRSKSVTLSNTTNRSLSLESWTVRNKAGDVQKLPHDAEIQPRVNRPFDVPNCPLSDHGDTIILMNQHGLRVDGVSYNSRQGGIKGGPIVFAH